VPVTYLCPSWFNIGTDLQNRAVHALFMLSHVTHLTGSGYTPADTMRFANFAAEAALIRTPAPTAGAGAHLVEDTRVGADPNFPRPRVP
jgi:hypothetical protein